MADDATVEAEYLAKVAADLERNERERARVADELATLQAQLQVLKRDRDLLLDLQQTVARQKAAHAGADGPAAPAATGDGTRQSAAAGRERRGGSGAFKGSAAGAPGAPTLRELVLAHLRQTSQPTSAAEVGTALAQEHPERSIQIAVVRNTLEGLVAKGQAVRSKENRAVFYSPLPDRHDSSSAQDAGTSVA